MGEWNYYILGSAVEAILLGVVIHHSWTWHPADRSQSSLGQRGSHT